MEKVLHFKKSEYIENYKISLREFYLMGLVNQLAYSARVCKSIVDYVPNVGDKQFVACHIVPYRYGAYFKRNGCKIDLIQSGDLKGTTKITRISEDTYQPTKIDYERLDGYINKVATVQADIIQELLAEYFSNIGKNLENGEPLNLKCDKVEEIKTTFDSELLSRIRINYELGYVDSEESKLIETQSDYDRISKIRLTEEQLDKFLAAELSMIIRELEFGEKVELGGSKTILNDYAEFLKRQNYEVNEERSKIIARKIY